MILTNGHQGWIPLIVTIPYMLGTAQTDHFWLPLPALSYLAILRAILGAILTRWQIMGATDMILTNGHQGWIPLIVTIPYIPGTPQTDHFWLPLPALSCLAILGAILGAILTRWLITGATDMLLTNGHQSWIPFIVTVPYILGTAQTDHFWLPLPALSYLAILGAILGAILTRWLITGATDMLLTNGHQGWIPLIVAISYILGTSQTDHFWLPLPALSCLAILGAILNSLADYGCYRHDIDKRTPGLDSPHRDDSIHAWNGPNGPLLAALTCPFLPGDSEGDSGCYSDSLADYRCYRHANEKRTPGLDSPSRDDSIHAWNGPNGPLLAALTCHFLPCASGGDSELAG